MIAKMTKITVLDPREMIVARVRVKVARKLHTIVLVESIGGTTPYVIPSFPFVTVKLVHIKFQVYGDETVYDGFLGAEEECRSAVSAVHEGSVLRICHGHLNAFLIDQEEFSKSIVTAGNGFNRQFAGVCDMEMVPCSRGE